MSDFSHVDDYPDVPVSVAATSTTLMTGEWRSVRPVLVERLAPCSAGCPAGNLFPSFAAEIAAGRVADAFTTAIERNPFPRITGRVCPRFCEQECNLASRLGVEAVSIRALERWMGDETAHLPYPQPIDETGLRVAVVGSGPAGLSAAFFLRYRGHRVTVFDRKQRAGGMLRYGIPEYRLPSAIVDDEIERLTNMGVEFRTGWTLGVDATLEELDAEFDGVFVATGAWNHRPMNIEGESLMEPGLAFLEEAGRGSARLVGERCAVVGGGNTAMDVARVLGKMGAEVTVLYRRTASEMPAIAEEYENAVAEGTVFRWLSMPRSVSKDGAELAVSVENMHLGDPDASGRSSPEPTGEFSELRFDAVFSAIGETADTSVFPAEAVDEAGWLAVGEDGTVANSKVLAGGDLISGPATVVEAIASGRMAARAIDRRLGFGHLWPNERDAETVGASEVNPAYAVRHARVADHTTWGVGLFDEETATISGAEALSEIERCLSCGHCNACGTCFVFCPDGAIKWDDGPVLDLQFCKGCGICVTECPGHVVILVNEREATSV